MVKVYDHDFNTFSDGVVIPHGIYDLKRSEGYITLGTSKDTSEFCYDCIKDWWENCGKENYLLANSILAWPTALEVTQAGIIFFKQALYFQGRTTKAS